MAGEEKLILVIDDEEGACDFIKSFLEDRGYSAVSAFNGRDGLDIIIKRSPALVFLDIRMPEMNGMDMLAELNERGIKTNIVLMTGVEEEEKLDKARELGARALLRKPVELKALNDMVKEYIG